MDYLGFQIKAVIDFVLNNRNGRLFVFTFLLLILFSDCFVGIQRDIPQEYKYFFELAEKEQCREFKKYPLEKQFDLAVLIYNRTQPPNGLFFSLIASEGERALPFLLDKLKKENDEYTQEHIISIFSKMTVDYYKLDDRKDIFELINTTISSMKNNAIKRTCVIYLEQMEKFKGKPPFFKETLRKEPC